MFIVSVLIIFLSLLSKLASGVAFLSENSNTSRYADSEYWYMVFTADISARTKNKMAPRLAAALYPSLSLSMSLEVLAPSFSFSPTSNALVLVSSSVLISSVLSSMLPVEVASSLSSESSRSLSSFLFSLVSWISLSLCSSSSFRSYLTITLSNWSSRPFNVTVERASTWDWAAWCSNTS
ncbi:hypothetical protein BpHYR1_015873 [Brachionus plicatilis]|uniref:Secreted protein n=1 Tax=Brachionus plicatilis TaxID=10195 RepID=A0A3M7QW63_BRAPC|nr:hypothetical protein BpHYR1_015873 [Brachionus plicatilis]